METSRLMRKSADVLKAVDVSDDDVKDGVVICEEQALERPVKSTLDDSS